MKALIGDLNKDDTFFFDGAEFVVVSDVKHHLDFFSCKIVGFGHTWLFGQQTLVDVNPSKQNIKYLDLQEEI